MLVALVGLAGPLASPAHAQGDWSVRRDPFDRKVIARYKRILAANPGDAGALDKLARLYRRYRSVELLVSEYERELERKPDDYAAAVVLGHLHRQAGERDQARDYFQRAARLRPQSAAVQSALGDLYREDGKAAEARAAYEQALAQTKRKPERIQLVRALAELSLSQGDLDGARGFYEQYFELAPKDIQARVALGDALAQGGRHQEAVAVLEEAARRLGADPVRRVELIARIGAVHEAAGQEDEALRLYRQAMAKVGRSYYLRQELTARVIEIYRRRQALGDLIAEYQKAWPERRRGHFEWDTLARLYEETGDQERAIDAYRLATNKAPYELDTRRRLIALLENTGREDQALAQYEAVIRVAPGEPRFQLELAERYWRRGKEKEALALLGKVSARFSGDAGVHATIADLYTRWGKQDLALAAYARLTRIEPGEVSHIVNLGEQYFLRNDKKRAVAVWKKLIAAKTPAGYARLGEVYAEHDMLPEALTMYGKAIRLQPDQAGYFKGRAGVYERRREFDRAVVDWEKVLSLTPSTAANKPARREARRRIVSLLRRGSSSRLRSYRDAWWQAFGASPRDIEAGYFLVEYYLRQQKYRDARKVLEDILAADGDDTEAMELLVKVYERQADYDQAVELLERLAEKVPARQRDFYTRIAELKTADRKDDEALDYARRALEQSPGDPLAHQRLAERYAAMQRFDEAIAAYEKAVELDPRNFSVYFSLARLYKNRYARAKAAEAYREVLRRASDEKLLRRAGTEAIALEELTGTLGELERVIAPLAFTYSHKPIYRRILVELYDRYVPALVRTWRTGPADARVAARAELDRLGSHGLKPLLEALSDETDMRQQRIAVAVLGYLGNRGAATPLVRLAQKPGLSPKSVSHSILSPTLEIEVRLDALVAAGRLGDPRIIADLIALGRGDSGFREATLFGLGRTGDARAVEPLLAALADGQEADAVLGCLGLAQSEIARKRGGRERVRVVGVLRSLVGDRRRGDLSRAACAFALGTLEAAEAVPTLVSVLGQDNGETQRLAAWALGRLGAQRIGADLGAVEAALLRTHIARRQGIRDAARAALGALAARAAVGALDRARPSAAKATAPELDLFPTTASGRYDAAAVVHALPGGDPHPATLSPARLGDLLSAHEVVVAEALVAVLGRHRDLVAATLEDLDGAPGHLTLGPLTESLATAPAPQRAQALAVLGRIGPRLMPALAALTRHRDPTVRALVMSVIAKIDTPEAADLVLAGMGDATPQVQRAAMRAAARHIELHERGGRPLASAVAARLRAGERQVRADAAATLGELGPLADLDALIDALADDSGLVRERAVISLGRLAGAGIERDRIAEALVQASGEVSAYIRLAATEALAQTGTRAARERLRELADRDPDARVVEAARRLLEKNPK
ncbi:tetratricopeptide repeat protein [Haliangium sp.]|uniref:tetratricopeptide repeat protein n=1 Tax=Haliangium sp. TaxID=2663208 RepID=UPI003D10F5EC